jgi:hypothetical protein
MNILSSSKLSHPEEHVMPWHKMFWSPPSHTPAAILQAPLILFSDVAHREDLEVQMEWMRDILNWSSLVLWLGTGCSCFWLPLFVGIVPGYGLDNGAVRVRVPIGSRIFLFSKISRPIPRPYQPPIQWVPGSLSPWAKWTESEAHHSPPNSAEVKKTWVYTPTLPYAFVA